MIGAAVEDIDVKLLTPTEEVHFAKTIAVKLRIGRQELILRSNIMITNRVKAIWITR